LLPTKKPAIPALGFTDRAAIIEAAKQGATMTVTGRQSEEPVYQVARTAQGAIPSNPTYRFKAANLHTRTEQYRALGTGDIVHTSRFRYSDTPSTGVDVLGRTPFSRTDYLSTGEWASEVDLGVSLADDGTPADQPGSWWTGAVRLKAGERSSDTWLAGPLLAAVSAPEDSLAVRYGEDFWFDAGPWNDGNRAHDSYAQGLRGSWALRSSGKVIAEGEGFFGAAQLPAGRRTYTLTYSGKLAGFPAVQRSRSLSVKWVFPSAASDESEPPLVSLRVKMPLDRWNRLTHGTTSTVTVGATIGDSSTKLSSLTYAISADGGKTWRPARVAALGKGNFRVTVKQPDQPGGVVAVRIVGKAPGGVSVTQTIKQAYGLK
jgi:hypothetical protein